MSSIEAVESATRPDEPPSGRPARRISIWSASLAPTTIGLFALAFTIAFESLAVASVMPRVATDLGELRFLALAFAVPAAVAVIALASAGPWMDRTGPAVPLVAGVTLFVAGLGLAGSATSMEMFLVGRGIQGLGGGVIGVGIYVVIARVYQEQLRPRAFTVLTGAWVLPGFVGPFLAAQIAETFGWRWVFLGVPAIAVIALALMAGSLRGLRTGTPGTADHAKIGWAVVAATGVLGLTVAGQRTVGWWPAMLVAGVALILLAGPKLLPTGSWRGASGLPSVIGTRGLVSAGYAAAEAYIPLALIQFRDLTPVFAGAALTAAAVTWFGGAWAGSHLRFLADPMRRLRIGLLVVGLGVLSTFAVLHDSVPVPFVIAAWALAGLGMGLGYPTLSVLVIDHSPDGAGSGSGAAQINDSLVVATTLAIGSAAFAALLPTSPRLAVAVALLVAVLPLLFAWLPVRRISGPAQARAGTTRLRGDGPGDRSGSQAETTN